MDNPVQSFKFLYAYKIISEYYRDKKAKRSGVPYMNHIDEGCELLQHIGASGYTLSAFMLHPMVQSDEALKENFMRLNQGTLAAEIILAMEYRRVANLYLSKREIKSLDEIELSPLHEVNQMLWADKMQNYKDFTLHHLGTHPRTKELVTYFRNWLDKLEYITADKNMPGKK